MQRGYTLIELLLVIAIIAVIGGTATPFLSRFVLQTNFDSTTDRFIGAIYKAQAHAVDGKNNQTWGICKTGSTLRIFSSSCANPVFSENFSIPGSITVSNFADTTFNLRGEPTTSLSVQIISSIESVTIQLNTAGGLSVN